MKPTLYLSTTHELAEHIRETARRIPLGGEICIKGSYPISGYGLAVYLMDILEEIGAGRDIYPMLCHEAPRVTVDHPKQEEADE